MEPVNVIDELIVWTGQFAQMNRLVYVYLEGGQLHSTFVLTLLLFYYYA